MTAVAIATEAQALDRADRIRGAINIAWELIVQSYQARDWEALGYDAWDDYCAGEFGTTYLRLPREDRSEVIGSLRSAGLSIRAIAAATGESKSEIGRSLPTVPSGTVDTPTNVTGINGKRYTVTDPAPKPPPTPPIAETEEQRAARTRREMIREGELTAANIRTGAPTAWAIAVVGAIESGADIPTAPLVAEMRRAADFLERT